MITMKTKEKAIIVDVDGTLADMRGVRKPFEWDKVHLDKPHQDVIELVRDLAGVGTDIWADDDEMDYCPEGCSPGPADWENKYKIIITTGRDGVCEEATKQWLKDHKVPYDEFFIRPEGSFAKDNVIKSHMYIKYIYPKYDVKFVIDDRDQVVEMWRSLGLRVLQVAPGNF